MQSPLGARPGPRLRRGGPWVRTRQAAGEAPAAAIADANFSRWCGPGARGGSCQQPIVALAAVYWTGTSPSLADALHAVVLGDAHVVWPVRVEVDPPGPVGQRGPRVGRRAG